MMARQLAAQGVDVALVARSADALNAVATGINAQSGAAARARAYPHDVTCYGEVPALFQRICHDLGGLDLIVYAAGVMYHIAPDEYDFAKDKRVFDVNVLGAMAWLNEAAQRFVAADAGTIVGISSVAGDRGRRGQPAYGASKAALNAYLESLRNRLGKTGAAVVTVKPGPVDTRMTRDLDKKPLLISADEAARQILAAARRRAHTAYVPEKWRPIMAVLRGIPSPIFRKMNIP
jgi:short-subunit dehydrogenase